MRRWFILFCLLLTLFLVVACQKEEPSPEDISLSFADSQEGNWTNFRNPNFVYDLTVDSDGVVWTIGANGTLRYDPATEEAQYFHSQNGLLGNGSYNLLVGADGSARMMNEGRVVLFNGDAWEEFQPDNAPENFAPFAFAFAPSGEMWFLEGANIVRRFDGENWQEMKVGTFNQFIRVSAQGAVWVAGRELMSFDGVEWKEHPYPPETIGEMDMNIYSFEVDRQGNIWLTVGSTDRFSFLYRFNGQEWNTFELESDGLAPGYLGEMWPDPVEGIWYVSGERHQGGLVQLTHFIDEEHKTEHIIPSFGLLAKSLWGFAARPDGKLWFGSIGRTKWGATPPGIFHFTGQTWSHLVLPATIPDNWIVDCATTDDGRIWFSMGGDKLVFFDDTSFTDMTNQLSSLDSISYLAAGQENQMWAANLSELASVSLRTTNYASSFLTGPLIDVLAKDTTHGIWIGAAGGSIWRFDGNNFQNYPIPDFEGYSSVEAVIVTPDGRVIAGFLQGEIFELNLDSGLWKNVGSENFTQLYTMSFANDQLWVVASVESEQSAFSFDGTSWQELGIAFNDREIVRTIFNAADNTVWIGSSAGLIHFEPESGEYERFTQVDGLVDNNVTTICEGQNNAIWIGTQAGLSRYTP
ncbi:MAG: hypothetical protein DHS20C20_09560 [Ardenticatenaceae bacterium]|nr:MAG: hypothetical protein DHS20C20_09560 [Ardenticatenaceae bacterium]